MPIEPSGKGLWEARGQKSSLLDREYTLRVRPRKVVGVGILVVIIFAVFILGRWSVDSPELPELKAPSLPDVSDIPKSGWTESITGFVTGLFNGSGSDEEEEVESLNQSAAAAPAATPAPSTTEPAPAGTPAANVSTPGEEVIITKYSRVALAVTTIDKEWKETYGKMTQLSYTLKNNEEGTIKPDYLIMIVEGYLDEGAKKKVPLLTTHKELKAGQTDTSRVLIPSGFAYHPSTAGDLENVGITFQLYDAQGKLMTTYNKEFNLKG